MDEYLKIHLDPYSGLNGGGGSTPAPEETEAPVLNSTQGISPSDLSARPELGGGSAAGEAGYGTVDAGASPADPNLAAATQSQQSQAQTIREAAAYYGLDLSQYQDDAQAFAHLVQIAQQSRQRNYYTELGQQIAPHASAVQQYLKEYQTRSQQSQAPARKAWEAPEFDERWMGLVDRDPETGRFIPKAGVNPQYADKINDYADHVDRWTTQLARNPREALAGLIKEISQEAIEARFGAHQAQTEAQSIISGNESWLYQVDQASGRRLTDHQGKFLPTPLGARYYTHLQTLQRSGVRDARTLDTLAKQLLQSDIHAGTVQAQANAAQAATPQAQAAQYRPTVNPGQAINPARRLQVPGGTDPSEEGLNLSERMRRAMAEEGVSDSDFQHIFGN